MYKTLKHQQSYYLIKVLQQLCNFTLSYSHFLLYILIISYLCNNISTNVFADTLKSQLLKTILSQYNGNQVEDDGTIESVEGMVPQSPVVKQPQQPIVPEPQANEVNAPRVPSIQPVTNPTGSNSNDTPNIPDNPNAMQPE